MYPKILDCRDIGDVFTADLDGDVTCLCIFQLLCGAQMMNSILLSFTFNRFVDIQFHISEVQISKLCIQFCLGPG